MLTIVIRRTIFDICLVAFAFGTLSLNVIFHFVYLGTRYNRSKLATSHLKSPNSFRKERPIKYHPSKADNPYWISLILIVSSLLLISSLFVYQSMWITSFSPSEGASRSAIAEMATNQTETIQRGILWSSQESKIFNILMRIMEFVCFSLWYNLVLARMINLWQRYRFPGKGKKSSLWIGLISTIPFILPLILYLPFRMARGGDRMFETGAGGITLPNIYEIANLLGIWATSYYHIFLISLLGIFVWVTIKLFRMATIFHQIHRYTIYLASSSIIVILDILTCWIFPEAMILMQLTMFSIVLMVIGNLWLIYYLCLVGNIRKVPSEENGIIPFGQGEGNIEETLEDFDGDYSLFESEGLEANAKGVGMGKGNIEGEGNIAKTMRMLSADPDVYQNPIEHPAINDPDYLLLLHKPCNDKDPDAYLSFENFLQSLPKALMENIGFESRLNARVEVGERDLEVAFKYLSN